MKEENLISTVYITNNSDSSNDIIIICTAISSIIALISLFISLYSGFLQFKDRLLKKKVLGYIYSFFEPSYIASHLPTTQQIKNHLKCFLFSDQDIFDTIIELNKENFIAAVGDLDTNLSNLRWKPNTIYSKKGNT